MNEEHNPKPEMSEASAQALPSIAQPTNNPTPAPPHDDAKEDGDGKKMTRSEKIMTVATVVIAIGTLVSAGAICFQWHEMHEGGTDTKALVGYASRQADDADKMKDSADKFSRSAVGINTKLDTAVDKLNLQARAARDLAIAANNQATKADKTFVASNRAYVNFHSIDQAENSSFYEYMFEVGNDGITATNGMTARLDCVRSQGEVAEPFSLLIESHDLSVPDILPPKRELKLSASVRSRCRVTFDEIEAIALGKEHFYFVGDIRYFDPIAPRKVRITQFCKELTLDIVTNGPKGPIASAISRGRHNCSDGGCRL